MSLSVKSAFFDKFDFLSFLKKKLVKILNHNQTKEAPVLLEIKGTCHKINLKKISFPADITLILKLPNGAIVGLARILIEEKNKDSINLLNLRNLSINPEGIRSFHKIGNSLIRVIKSICLMLKCSSITLFAASSGNTPEDDKIIAFYERNNFIDGGIGIMSWNLPEP